MSRSNGHDGPLDLPRARAFEEVNSGEIFALLARVHEVWREVAKIQEMATRAVEDDSARREIEYPTEYIDEGFRMLVDALAHMLVLSGGRVIADMSATHFEDQWVFAETAEIERVKAGRPQSEEAGG